MPRLSAVKFISSSMRMHLDCCKSDSVFCRCLARDRCSVCGLRQAPSPRVGERQRLPLMMRATPATGGRNQRRPSHLDELGQVVRQVPMRHALQVVVVGILRHAAIQVRPRQVVDGILVQHAIGVGNDSRETSAVSARFKRAHTCAPYFPPPSIVA